MLVLVKAREDKEFLARVRVDVALQALCADLFHHALHGRIDRADRDVFLLQIWFERSVPCLANAVHHTVRADGDDSVNVFEIDGLRSQFALGVGDHRLDYVAAEMGVLRPLRLDLGAPIGRPDDLVGRILDLLAFEEVGAVLVAREIDDFVVLFAKSPCDREKYGIAEAAAGKQDVLVLRYLGRRAGRTHDKDLFALFQQRAKPRRSSHFEDDHRKQAFLFIDPRAGKGESFH